MGLSLEETMLMPLCELLDLICVHQIKAEGFEYCRPMSDREALMDILRMR